MEDQTFRDFLDNHYHVQLNKSKRMEAHNAHWYQTIQWLTIGLSIVTALLIGSQQYFNAEPLTNYLKFGSLASSVIVSGLATALKTFNFQERGNTYHNRTTNLETEYYLFISSSEPYTSPNIADNRRLFVQNFSRIISESERGITYGGTV